MWFTGRLLNWSFRKNTVYTYVSSYDLAWLAEQNKTLCSTAIWMHCDVFDSPYHALIFSKDRLNEMQKYRMFHFLRRWNWIKSATLWLYTVPSPLSNTLTTDAFPLPMVCVYWEKQGSGQLSSMVAMTLQCWETCLLWFHLKWSFEWAINFNLLFKILSYESWRGIMLDI